MSDISLERAREAARRGKDGRPKRLREPTRGVRDDDGRVVGVVHGRGVTEEDVEAARLLISCMRYQGRPVSGGGDA